MNGVFSTILLVVLGWLLGILSPVIVDRIRHGREAKELRVALISELTQLRYRLAIAAYFVQMHLGTVDRQFLEWLKPVLEGYDGPDSIEDILKAVNDQLRLTDGKIAAFVASQKAKPEQSITFKKYAVPLLDSRITMLSAFKVAIRDVLLAIRTHLNFLNEEVDEARFYLRHSFDTSPSQNNYAAIRDNLDSSIEHVGKRARSIVDLIGDIEKL